VNNDDKRLIEERTYSIVLDIAFEDFGTKRASSPKVFEAWTLRLQASAY
jgi:hypothetical protein